MILKMEQTGVTIVEYRSMTMRDGERRELDAKGPVGDNEPPGDNRTFPSRVSAGVNHFSARLFS